MVFERERSTHKNQELDSISRNSRVGSRDTHRCSQDDLVMKSFIVPFSGIFLEVRGVSLLFGIIPRMFGNLFMALF